jgi:hypothetical protein
MTRYLPYLLYLWLIGLHQVILSDLTIILGVKINMVMLIVVIVALFKSEINTLWFSFSAGLVGYAGNVGSFGWYVLVTMLVAMCVYYIKIRMNLESMKTKVLFLIGGVLVHNIFLLILSDIDNFLIFFIKQALLGALYTMFVGWVFFLIKEENLTFKKIRSIFSV